MGRVGPFVGGIEAKLRSLKIGPERLRAAVRRGLWAWLCQLQCTAGSHALGPPLLGGLYGADQLEVP